ncbi:MAG: threonine synthase [Actinobacteria bacterium]|nr:threonine synthase [Actinomycetota bacterium]
MATTAESLRCKECGRTYPLQALFVCDYCFGPLEVVYDYEKIRRRATKERIAFGPPSLWRYADFLPVSEKPAVDLQAGYTPLLKADRLAAELGLKKLWVKNDTANPTHSFKDRVVSVALQRALELKFNVVACASTGNLANSVAAHAAATGTEAYVFVPANLEIQKIIATAVYGVNVVKVRGNYDDVNRLCTEIASEKNWAFVNVNVRPYYAEGSKTLAFETAEQLGWRAPDKIVTPVASGSLLTKIYKGYWELGEVGLIRRKEPAICGAQAEGCSPVAAAFKEGLEHVKPVKPDTIAKSLAIGNPADGIFALEIARRTGGVIESVSEQEIVDGIRLLAQTTGIFTETAGGVTTAVLAKLAARGKIHPQDETVIYITGDGLKTLDAVADTISTFEIDPVLAQFEDQVLGSGAAAGAKQLVSE